MHRAHALPWRVLPVALALALALGAARVEAQYCGPTPPGFRPHVHLYPRATLVPTPSWSAGVHLRHGWCSYSREVVPPVRARDLRIDVVSGPSAGARLSARNVGEDLRVALPGPGTYELRVESTRFPALVPATARVMVADARRAQRVRLQLVPSPLDHLAGNGGTVSVVRDGAYAAAPATLRLRGDVWQTTVLSLEPGTYEVRWTSPSAIRRSTVQVSGGGDYRVTFPGARVRVETDWLPADGRMFEVVLERPDGQHFVGALGGAGASVGEDVPPGPALLRVRATPRRDPWSPGDPSLVWTELYHQDLEVRAQASQVVRWSMPRIVAGVPGVAAPAPWTELPGLDVPPSSASAPPPAEPAFALTAREGVVTYIGARVHVFDTRWSVLEPGPTMRRATSAVLRVDGAGIQLPHNTTFAASALQRDALAWTEGGEFVSFRTRAGLAQELLPVYEAARPSPCYTTGVAAVSARDVVAVGRCRANAPESDTSYPHEGFIVTRDETRWSLRPERPPPLRAVASEGDTVVAVGDRGAVLWRRAGVWTLEHRGADDLVAVAMSGPRVVARTRGGELVDIPAAPGVAPVALPRFVDAGVAREASAHCVTPDGVVALFPRWRRANEGGAGPFTQPARVARFDGARYAVLHDGAAGEAAAMACDGATVWLLVRGPDGALTVVRR